MIRPFRLLLFVCVLCITAGCGERLDRDKRVGLPGIPESPTERLPGHARDLAQIQAEGVLRVITRPGPLTYMVFQGDEAGFEFELLRIFCDEWNLDIEVVLLRPGEDPFHLLDEGRGDLISTGLLNENELKNRCGLTQAFEHTGLHLALPASDPDVDTLNIPIGLNVTVPAGSQALRALRRLREQDRLDIRILRARPQLADTDLMRMVAWGEIEATAAPASSIEAAAAQLGNLVVGPPIGPPSHRVWAVGSASQALRDALDRYLARNYGRLPDGARRSRNYGIVHDRYISDPKQVRWYRQDRFRPDRSGVLSPWDTMIKRECEPFGLDWLIVASLMFEESRFDHEVVSSAGAVGLMQVMPRISEADSAALSQPELNIREGVAHLADIWNSYDYLPDADRWPFTLATYHAGIGHMNDARRIAMDAELDPNVWRNNVEVGLHRLRDRGHYSRTRHGYYRGDMSADYAESILRRRKIYKIMLERYEGRPEGIRRQSRADDTEASTQNPAAITNTSR